MLSDRELKVRAVLMPSALDTFARSGEPGLQDLPRARGGLLILRECVEGNVPGKKERAEKSKRERQHQGIQP